MNILRLTYFRNEYFFAWKKRLLVKSQSIFLNQGKIYRTDVLLSKIQKDRILQSFFLYLALTLLRMLTIQTFSTEPKRNSICDWEVSFKVGAVYMEAVWRNKRAGLITGLIFKLCWHAKLCFSGVT